MYNINNQINKMPQKMRKKIVYRVIKFIFDEIIALISVIILLPLFLIVAILIKIDSKGPAIYKQERYGKNKKLFKMYKFRTMVINADTNGGKITGKNDARVTKIGRILRATKIDELPQLFNIIKGQMSIIGPRPEVEKFVQLYSEQDNLVFTVRPGLSDYSSVKYMNMDEIFENSDPDSEYVTNVLPDKNRLRLKYVYEFNLWVDIKIFFSTIFGIIKKVFSKFKKRKKPDLNNFTSQKITNKETKEIIV